MATYQEVYQEALEYYGGDDLCAKTFIDKYALRDNDDNFLETTPEDMHRRLAKEFARIEKKYPNPLSEEVIFNYLKDFSHIVPQGSPMAAIGNQYQVMSLSNCVVVPSPEDSIHSIMDAGKTLAQFFKRRCVEQGTLVISKTRGPISIKEIKVGEEVLSFDIDNKTTCFKLVLDKFETKVPEEDRLLIEASSGAKLKTSNKHPVLTYVNGKLDYVLASDIKVGDVLLRPSNDVLINNHSRDIADIAWFIGAHIGDGICDYTKGKCTKNYSSGQKVYYYPKYRFRITGDNEAVIAEYCRIHNKMVEGDSTYHKSYNKQYNTDCWEYNSACKKNEQVLNKFLDGQYGKKVYTAKTPRFIKENNLWGPYIAGLLDSDGFKREEGLNFTLSMCAPEIIDDVAAYLSSVGIPIKTSVKEPRHDRPNEATAYSVSISSCQELINLVRPYLKHTGKVKRFEEAVEYREWSRKFPLMKNEVDDILDKYQSMEWGTRGTNLSAIICLLRKDKTGAGIGALRELSRAGLISDVKIEEIRQRVVITSIERDQHSSVYFDIEVKGTNNFFAGNFGLLNIHNCGVGLDISNLRPEGTRVNNAARTTTGAWSFADYFSNVCRMIGQSGRRGALMETLDVRHPDVFKFVTMKEDLNKVTGANVSIKIVDSFMEAVKNDTEFQLQWPVDSENPSVAEVIRARDLWDVMISAVHKSAEPGLLMWGNIEKTLPAHCYPRFKTICVNPCAELPLSELDSCRLLTINLSTYVINRFTKDAYFDFESFRETVVVAQRLMDDIIDIEIEQIDKIIKLADSKDEKDIWEKMRDHCEAGRRTGLGTFALGDALANLCIPYDSSEALEITANIFSCLRDTAYSTSIDLAEERGSFPDFDWDLEKNCEFFDDMPKKIINRMKIKGRRNISILTNAPTGSVAIVSHNSSSGIEPVFRNVYTRRKKINSSDGNVKVDFIDQLGDRWQEFNVFHRNISDWIKINYPDWDGKSVPELPDYFISSDKIDWENRVRLQGVIQKHIDHSISSTINLPSTVSKETVSNLYLKAWEEGLKGVTIYVDGSRSGVLVNNNDKKDSKGRPTKVQRNHAPKRPEVLPCDIYHGKVQGEHWTIVVGLLEGEPYELFGGPSEDAGIPKAAKSGFMKKFRLGKNRNSYTLIYTHYGKEVEVSDIGNIFENKAHGTATRLISLALRHGAPVPHIVEQLGKDESEELFTLSSILRRALKKYIEDGTIVSGAGKTCDKCGSANLKYQEGCPVCLDCGFARCK